MFNEIRELFQALTTMLMSLLLVKQACGRFWMLVTTCMKPVSRLGISGNCMMVRWLLTKRQCLVRV
eukprot:jgi/Botrbrau1/10878/Bobra.0025s0055.1